MSENKKTTLEVVDATEEKKPEGFFAKVGAAIKKHGKKIATVVGIGAVGVVAYALGRNSAVADSEGCYDDEDAVEEDFEYVETE